MEIKFSDISDAISFQQIEIMVDGDQDSMIATGILDSNLVSFKIKDLSGDFKNKFENGIQFELSIPEFMKFNQG